MKALNHSETSDTYAGVIAQLDNRTRVVVCKGNHQWIAQVRGKGGAERPWKAVGYFRTKSALIRVCAASCREIDPKARATLDALPENFGEGT